MLVVATWACPQMGTAVVEPYVHSLLEHTDVTIMMNNEALYDILRRQRRQRRAFAWPALGLLLLCSGVLACGLFSCTGAASSKLVPLPERVLLHTLEDGAFSRCPA